MILVEGLGEEGEVVVGRMQKRGESEVVVGRTQKRGESEVVVGRTQKRDESGLTAVFWMTLFLNSLI